MGRKFGFSFSWKRAIGISGLKNRISRKIGIPLTRSGRQRKVGRAAGCFIATAAYGNAESPEVRFLRGFRDRYLQPCRGGRLLIALYYAIGPTLAAPLKNSPFLRKFVCLLLDGIIQAIKRFTGERDGQQ
jgi:hypothetical protein